MKGRFNYIKKGKTMTKGIISLIGGAFLVTGCAINNTNITKSDTNQTHQNYNESEITALNNSDFINELALHDAVRARDLSLVNFLIAQKSDLNAKDIYGYTPLHIAVRLKEFEIAKVLIDSGASVNTKDTYADTPLLDATRNDYTEISKLLICNNANRNVADKHQMTPLHNSSKNKNLVISQMLRSETLLPYCSKLGVKITDMDIVSSEYKVCGDFVNDVNAQNSLKVSISDLFGNKSNEYKSTKEWCSVFPKNLNDGTYDLTAQASDIYDRNATDNVNLNISDDIKELYTNRFKISIDDVDQYESNSTIVCGDINIGDAKKVAVTLIETQSNKTYGVFETKIDSKNNRWCSDTIDGLIVGTYLAKAKGIDGNGSVSVAIDDAILLSKPLPKIEPIAVAIESSKVESMGFALETPKEEVVAIVPLINEPKVTENFKGEENKTNGEIFIGLYDALYDEFKDDFKKWNAELTEDELTFRFKDPNALFSHAKSDLKEKLTNMLGDFFPRYLKIIQGYAQEIAEVAIEGHTSSSYKLAKNDKERYDFNKKLSQARADEVRKYCIKVASQNSDLNQKWIEETFKGYGKSYDNLIVDIYGNEDAKASRRVEFKINRKKGIKPVMKKLQ